MKEKRKKENKAKQRQKRTRGTKAIVKKSELNDFVVRFLVRFSPINM